MSSFDRQGSASSGASARARVVLPEPGQPPTRTNARIGGQLVVRAVSRCCPMAWPSETVSTATVTMVAPSAAYDRASSPL